MDRSAKITASDKLAENHDWRTAQREHEINRLEAILRNPAITAEERRIAKDQMAHWKGQNEMASASNYPPGHPTGIRHGEETQVFYCEGCNTLWAREELLRLNKVEVCPTCRNAAKLERALCAKSGCSTPATHIDVELDVNAADAFCSKH